MRGLPPRHRSPLAAGRPARAPWRVWPRLAEEDAAGARPGQTVGPYEIERLLGKGGMGAVYLAHRRAGAEPGAGEAPGARVALKVMLPRMVVDEGAQEIFIREIEVTRSLRHPNIVGLLDFGKHQGRFYFALEYCPGGSAEDLRRRHGGRVPLPSVLRIAVDALEGLAVAHEAGFVHRDLKPDNVLLAEGGTARLADFGLAKSFQQAGLSGMTATGMVAGTFQFMPREQLTSYRQVRPTSDVWSMAATVYYLLSGEYARDFDAHSGPSRRDPSGRHRAPAATRPVRSRRPRRAPRPRARRRALAPLPHRARVRRRRCGACSRPCRSRPS